MLCLGGLVAEMVSRVIPGTPNNGSGMGIVWKACHKGITLLGVSENPIDGTYCLMSTPVSLYSCR